MSARDELFGVGQLLAGWTLLAIATWLIGRLYGFPVFYADPEAEIAAAAADVDSVDDAGIGIGGLLPPHPGFSMTSHARNSHPRLPPGAPGADGRRFETGNGNGGGGGRGEDFVKLWTAAELVFFCLLATLACLLFYCCRHRRHRSKTWQVLLSF